MKNGTVPAYIAYPFIVVTLMIAVIGGVHSHADDPKSTANTEQPA